MWALEIFGKKSFYILVSDTKGSLLNFVFTFPHSSFKTVKKNIPFFYIFLWILISSLFVLSDFLVCFRKEIYKL